jgi:hypothetical protein
MAAARILIDLCNAPQARCLWGAESFDDSAIERTAANIAHIFLRAYSPEPAPDLQHDAEGPMGSGEKGAEK